VVKQIRRAAGGLKTGHAGTLDPFAEGLLIVGIGRAATRRLGDYMKLEKEYFAAVAWGAATDTGDPTGKIVAEAYEARKSLAPIPRRCRTDAPGLFSGQGWGGETL